MKKLLTIATVAVFILTLAAVTYAIDLKASGYARTRTALGVNLNSSRIDATDDGFNDTNSEVDQRFRLTLDAVANENVSGQLRLQTSGDWGEDGDMAAFDAGAVDVQVIRALMTFKVPGLDAFPTELDVGVQSFYLGRFGIDTEAAGVTVDSKLEPAEIRFIYVKEDEGPLDYQADDVDEYGVRVTYPMGDWRPGVWFLYTNYGGQTGRVDASPLVSTSGDLYWIGLTADGKIGPVSLNGDFVYNGGSLDFSTPAAIVAGGTAVGDIEYGGYVFHVRGSMPVGDMYEVGAVFMYASGDDLRDKSSKGEVAGFHQPRGGASFRPTQVYYGSSVNDSVGLVSRAGQRGFDPAATVGDWLVQGFVSAKPLDWLKVTGYVAYIGDNVDNGDRIGTATDSTGALEDNSDAGFEVDATADIQIYKELAWRIGAGILFAGDALDSGTGVAGVNKSPDDPWVLVSQLIYSF